MKSLPPSALYSHPALGRLWQKVHRTHSPFLRRSSTRRLYTLPAAALLPRLRHQPYHLLALGCADGAKEHLLLQKLPPPQFLLAADTNLTLARLAARRLPALYKAGQKIDLTSPAAFSIFSKAKTRHRPLSSSAPPRLITLFGVLPNLPPQPLLRRLARIMRSTDLLLFSANLAPARSGFAGAQQVLSQYDNPATRRWLEAAIRRYRPRLPKGRLQFAVHPDPRQKSLARIEARWVSPKSSWIIFASRRPTASQVQTWLQSARLQKIQRWLDPQGEEGVWLVRRHSLILTRSPAYLRK